MHTSMRLLICLSLARRTLPPLCGNPRFWAAAGVPTACCSSRLPARVGWVRGRYARTANKRYSADPAALTDFETHFTVVCYEDDPALAASQVCPRTRLCAFSRRDLASVL